MTNLHPLQKVYGVFSLSIGIYGCKRGYKAKFDFEEELLTSEKILRSTFNGILYACPIMNIFPTIRLINRIEIKTKGLDPNKYKSAYQEVVGYCKDTI